MIVDVRGVLVPPALAGHVGKAIMQYINRNGVAAPALVVLQEECLRIARGRRNLETVNAARASSGVRSSLPFVRVLGTSEAAAISGWSIRAIQLFAASGAVGRKVNGRYQFTESEAEELARLRGKSSRDRGGSTTVVDRNGAGEGEGGRRGRGAGGRYGETARVAQAGAGGAAGGVRPPAADGVARVGADVDGRRIAIQG